MNVFRLCSKDYITLDGEGASLYGGRWNSIGKPLVYTSEHISLCVLEQLVHLNPNTFPNNWVVQKIEIPNSVNGETILNLPKTVEEAQKIGDSWIQSNKCLFLKVPSSIIQAEYNVLLNPLHNKMREAKVIEVTPFSLDSRLLK